MKSVTKIRFSPLFLMLGLQTAAFLPASLWAQAERKAPPPPPPVAGARPAAAEPETLEAIESAYQKELSDAETKRLSRIAALAGKKKGEESHALWRLYFETVIAEELFADAEKTAESLIGADDLPVDIKALAEVTHIIAEARRGALEESLASLKKLFETNQAPKNEEDGLPVHVKLGLVEVYLRTFVDAGRYDLAIRAIDTMAPMAQNDDVKTYLADEKTAIQRIGNPVPLISGTDVDGREFSMASLKGKPVLVLFWATWDEVSENQLESLISLSNSYKDKGLEVIAINVDNLRDNAEPDEDLAVDVRKFLIENNLLWKCLISENGEKDFAKQLGVRYLPANLVIDKTGIIRHADRSPAGLVQALADVCK
jgi:thiol-disulfide isomerase/thioredoxin